MTEGLTIGETAAATGYHRVYIHKLLRAKRLRVIGRKGSRRRRIPAAEVARLKASGQAALRGPRADALARAQGALRDAVTRDMALAAAVAALLAQERGL